jgi:hypothetical protein
VVVVVVMVEAVVVVLVVYLHLPQHYIILLHIQLLSEQAVQELQEVLLTEVVVQILFYQEQV